MIANSIVNQSNLLQTTSRLPIAQADVEMLDPITIYANPITPVIPTINPVTYVINHVSQGPTPIPGNHTNSQSNSGTRTINIVKPSVKKSSKEILEDAKNRAQRNADRAAKSAEKKAKKAKKAQDDANELQRKLEQAKQELARMGGATSRSLQKKISRLQRRANRTLQKLNDALLKANLLAQQAAILRQRAVTGVDKNIIEGAYQYALDSARDLSNAGSFGFELLRNPEKLENLLDAIEETRTALQDPARRAETIKLIDEALGEDVINAIENFSNDKDYYTGYIAASIFDPIGKIGKLGKLSDVARGGKNIVTTPKQLQKKFKHAEDFGVSGNYSPAKAKKFDEAIKNHLNASGTKEISGTYRGNPVTFHIDPSTGLTVIQKPNGDFLRACSRSIQ